MTEQPETHTTHAEDALDQLEEEIEHLEHVSRWGRWLGWGAAVVAVVAIVGAVLWTVLGPPPTTSARMAYVPAGSTSIDVSEPRGAATLGAPPSRFAWESVTGRFQYRVRVYVRDTSVPVVEKFVTTPFVELTPE